MGNVRYTDQGAGPGKQQQGLTREGGVSPPYAGVVRLIYGIAIRRLGDEAQAEKVTEHVLGALADAVLAGSGDGEQGAGMVALAPLRIARMAVNAVRTFRRRGVEFQMSSVGPFRLAEAEKRAQIDPFRGPLGATMDRDGFLSGLAVLTTREGYAIMVVLFCNDYPELRFSLKDIAEASGMSSENLREAIHAARAKMRRYAS